MSGIKNQAELEAMRKRLYERGVTTKQVQRTPLSDIVPTVAKTWEQSPVLPKASAPDPRDIDPPPTVPVAHPRVIRRKTYRTIILLGTLAIFLLVIGITGLYMFLGNNQISNKNIELTISGPISVGGGERLPLTFEIKNDNRVSIESAVLIVNFPSGTKSAEETPRDMLEDRLSVGTVAAGEAVKVPLEAIVFGEENQEREVKATVEYRLVGSSGTFYKEATPLLFKISSSPLVVRVESVKKVSSGQEVEVKLTLQSNAPTPLKDVLLTADYPANFDYSSASPAPLYRENAWFIEELQPEKAATITLKGVVNGKQDEEFQMKFQAGTPKPDNQFELGSLLANAVADFVIEQPFINVGLSVNGTEGEIITSETGERTNVTVKVRNTLTDTLYDMAVEVAVKGNILVRDRVTVQDGFYDSVKDVIRFEPSGNNDLDQVAPGELLSFNFSLEPSDRTETPSFTLTANAFARRVSETNATEQLVGTAKSEVKFTSAVTVGSELGRGTASFVETGPFPPVADIATTYTVTLIATAGGNDVTGAVMTTALPQYVNWQNQSSGDGSVTYNPVTKEVIWTVGEIEAGKQKQIAVQVSILPSQNQIGTTPAILAAQRFRATDRFTGSVVRAEASPLSTELAEEAGYKKGNGQIRRTTADE